jgi:hypothetical protein
VLALITDPRDREGTPSHVPSPRRENRYPGAGLPPAPPAVTKTVSGDENMRKSEEPETPEVISEVGVRNPFVLTEIILMERKVIKSPIQWSELSPEKARHLMEEAFGIPYEHLFDPDPEYQSPLYERPVTEREA